MLSPSKKAETMFSVFYGRVCECDFSINVAFYELGYEWGYG